MYKKLLTDIVCSFHIKCLYKCDDGETYGKLRLVIYFSLRKYCFETQFFSVRFIPGRRAKFFFIRQYIFNIYFAIRKIVYFRFTGIIWMCVHLQYLQVLRIIFERIS